MVDILHFGIFQLPWWGYVLYTLLVTHMTIVTVTVYYHRAKAHRALDLHPVLEYAFLFWGGIATGMSPREWAAIHRYHHAKNDGPDDPHSPWVYGIWYVLFLGVVLYYKAAQRSEVMMHCRDIPDNWLSKALFSREMWLGRFYGVALMLVIDVTLFGLVGLLIWVIQMLWIPFWAAGVINGIGHWPSIGYRNNETKDKSTNICRIGVWIGGEELHNNHHMYPKSAKLSLKENEFDVGWMYIRFFESIGLAKVKYIHDEKVV